MTATATAPTAATVPWTIDAAHTEVEFSVRHLMISNVKGRFSNPTGQVTYDPAHPESFAMEVTIPIASIDTRNEQRDAHLKSADFFDAEHFPSIVFTGKRIAGDVNDTFTLTGDLTIHGVTRGIALAVTAEGRVNDPWGNERLGFSATSKIDRRDFDMRWNNPLEGGGFVVGDDVKIIVNVELMRPKA